MSASDKPPVVIAMGGGDTTTEGATSDDENLKKIESDADFSEDRKIIDIEPKSA